MRIECARCGKPFTAKPGQGRKFCSSKCYHATRGEEQRVGEIKFNCKTCGEEFGRQPGALRVYVAQFGRPPLYCSRPCSAIGRRADAEARLDLTCIQCGGPITEKRKPSGYLNSKRLICSSECRSAFKLAEHERLRPAATREITRTVGRHGYIRLNIPARDGQPARKDVLEHRYVMEQMLGRELTDEETVHHRNGQKTDNRRINLSLRSGRHGPGGDVSAMIRWAHEIIAQYPQFDREGNFTPVDGSEAGHDQ